MSYFEDLHFAYSLCSAGKVVQMASMNDETTVGVVSRQCVSHMNAVNKIQ